MSTSEIEKLERRYTENPHGLTFAPLAEVHRKNGDLARALELLTAGLELHPNYIPASIVLGRCHQDLGDLPSAEAAFAHVLRLDDENVIALKSLADISERQERLGEAETWLRRLVAVDRSNDEAREQLERVEAARHAAEGTQTEPAAAPALEMIELTSEPEADSPEIAAQAEETSVDLAALEPSPSAAEEQRPAAEEQRPAAEEQPSEPMARVEEPSGQPAVPAEPPVPAAVGQDEDSGDTSAPVPETAAPSQAVVPMDEQPPATSDEPAREEEEEEEETVQPLPGLISAEFQPPLEAIGGLGVETSEEVVLEVSGKNSEFRVPDAAEDLKSLSARLNSPAPAENPEKSAPEPRPEVAREPEAVVPDAAVPAAAEQRSYVAADTKGQSVADFFRALVTARPVSAGGDTPAQPARTAALGNSGRGDESSPSGPAVPGGEHQDAAVSFDDFFNSESDGSRSGNDDSGKDDLDQFQSWLQNLKR